MGEYKDFITGCLEREADLLASGEFVERHHIKPKSLGGTDEPFNLVAVTPGDHFRAHYLLAEQYGGSQWLSVLALVNMDASNKRGRDLIRADVDGYADMVQRARVAASKVRAKSTRRQHANSNLGALANSPEARAKRSEAIKDTIWINDGERNLRIKNYIEIPDGWVRGRLRDDWSSSIKTIVAYNQSPEAREVRRQQMLVNNPAKSPEAKAIMSAKSKAYRARPEVRAKYSKAMTGDRNPTKRPEVAAKIAEARREEFKKNPLQFAKDPVMFEGELMSYRQAALRAKTAENGLSDNSSKMKAKAEQRGMTLQQWFDHCLVTTPAERKAEGMRLAKRAKGKH